VHICFGFPEAGCFVSAIFCLFPPAAEMPRCLPLPAQFGPSPGKSKHCLLIRVHEEAAYSGILAYSSFRLEFQPR
jgi:hypothetical protein